jgi:hypothetical protein
MMCWGFCYRGALLCFSLTRPIYEELEAELLAVQHASPDSAMTVAQTLL